MCVVVDGADLALCNGEECRGGGGGGGEDVGVVRVCVSLDIELSSRRAKVFAFVVLCCLFGICWLMLVVYAFLVSVSVPPRVRAYVTRQTC